jgi:hypothetical protein
MRLENRHDGGLEAGDLVGDQRHKNVQQKQMSYACLSTSRDDAVKTSLMICAAKTNTDPSHGI